MADRLPTLRHRRQQHDTAAWCAERADADRITAAAAINDNIRRRHELSAESWNARAEMLRRIEGNTRVRSGTLLTEVSEETLPSPAARHATALEAEDVRF
jgi:hypothetical protein